MVHDYFTSLTQEPASHVETLMRGGQSPPAESLVNFEWRGYNTGWQARLLGIQKFIKGFFLAGGDIEGYNIPVEQNGLEAAWLHEPSSEYPRRYAFFVVTPVDPSTPDRLYPGALLLNYGASRRSTDAPAIARRIRDYLVLPDPADPDVLLGKAYLAFGSLRLPSNYFILQRLRPSDWRP
jgi:hypothetical protein